jgi:predicted RNA-binding Zn-ribbon protein involved in translation (DUF1610 family)
LTPRLVGLKINLEEKEEAMDPRCPRCGHKFVPRCESGQEPIENYVLVYELVCCAECGVVVGTVGVPEPPDLSRVEERLETIEGVLGEISEKIGPR